MKIKSFAAVETLLVEASENTLAEIKSEGFFSSRHKLAAGHLLLVLASDGWEWLLVKEIELDGTPVVSSSGRPSRASALATGSKG